MSKALWSKFNYSFIDSLTFSFTACLNELIKAGLNASGLVEPRNDAMHVMADLIWKFYRNVT